MKAKLVQEDAAEPVQINVSISDAADLAFIANDFVRAVPPDSPEAKRMVELAAMLSGRILDLLAARAGISIPASALNMVPDFVPEPEDTLPEATAA